MKKHCAVAICLNWFLDARALKTAAKTSVLDRLYAEKRVNYGVFDGKNIVKTLKKTKILKDFLYIHMLELTSGIGTWKN